MYCKYVITIVADILVVFAVFVLLNVIITDIVGAIVPFM